MYKKKIINPIQSNYAEHLHYREGIKSARGASFLHSIASNLKSAFRAYNPEPIRSKYVGIRICLKRK